ncbi:MAG: hypothetical protein D6776_01240 [Planctomycetota bacterium]|nr:MAG: hypothetical protein D6776_01240 [Planctomycetota bacterium]
MIPVVPRAAAETTGPEDRSMFRHSRIAAASLLAALAAAPATARPGGSSAESPTATATVQASLDAQYEALERQAARLAAAYEKAIAARVAELAAADPTIAYLVDKNLLSAEALTRGLPTDPLARVPWLRTTLARVDERAKKMAARFGDVTLRQNERAAIRALVAIARAQERYRESDTDGNGVFDYAESLDALALEGFEADDKPGYVRRHGYRFRLLHGDVLSWSAEALPLEPGKTGRRFFFIDERGQVRENTGGPAGASSPLAPEQAEEKPASKHRERN